MRIGHPRCDQCGRPAIGSVNGVNLCVDCYSRFQAANMEQARALMAMHNYLNDQMDDVIGLGGIVNRPRIEIPAPAPVVATRGPMTLHNISISGSVVGAINTGEVQKIDVAIDHIKIGGAAELADSLKSFTEAVLADTQTEGKAKGEVLEQLSFLSDQALTPQDQRKPGMIKSSLSNIGAAVSVSTGLITLWEHLHPLLAAAFK